MESIRVVCAHDCPDMCSLLAHVEDGKSRARQGDPDQPFTAGFACAKVNRDAELVNSPERIATPLRRIGAKGEGKFTPITWDEALDEITVTLEVHHRAKSGPLALLGYAYCAHQGLMNRGLLNGLFHALGTSACRPARCATPAARRRGTRRSGRSAAPIPKSVVAVRPGDLAGAPTSLATNVHFWALGRGERASAACRSW